MTRIVVNLDDGFDSIVQSLDDYQKRLSEKGNLLVTELAKMGVELAGPDFNGASYDGNANVTVTWESRGDMAAAVVASGEGALFLEFGAGYLMGYGHPEPLGYGPGTYPGKGHWDDPNGWYYEHGKKSYGNPPTAAMYNARKIIQQNLKDLAKGILQ